MPELPEVEVTRQGLLPHLVQRTVTAVRWSAKKLRLPIPRKLLQQHIQNNTISAVDRRAKYLLIRMEDGSVLVVHLGMTGKLGLFPTGEGKDRHDHLMLALNDGMEMRFNDARRFGSVLVWPASQAVAIEQEFDRSRGLEPFGHDFNASNLAGLAGQRKLPIKNFLMDSRLIAGVGNIYANETLFAAGIHPLTRVNTLSEEQWEKIAACCRRILGQAIAAGGSTISDFLGASGTPGYFQLQLCVYGKKDSPCPKCGATVIKEKIGGRATFYCSACQSM